MKHKPHDRVSLTIHLYAGGFATQITSYGHAREIINSIEDGLYRMSEDQLNQTILGWDDGHSKIRFRLVRVVGYHLTPVPEDRMAKIMDMVGDIKDETSEGDGWKKE